MTSPIYPCLWFDNQAQEAASFYIEVFKNGKITVQSPIIVNLELHGQKMMCLNGGPIFRINPSISFYVICETKTEIDEIWEKLGQKGKTMMEIDKYPWSERYGWVEDRYGVSWQLTLGKISDMGQKFTPALMFTGDQFGMAEEALLRYTSIFNDSTTHFIWRYDVSDQLQGGKIQHCQFSLLGKRFIMMDSGLFHDFSFSEGLSLVVNCETQEEIDYFWNKLTEGGEESQCGWLKDKFGVSWQIVPTVLESLMADPERSPRVIDAFMKMKKFDIEKLLNA